MEKTEKATPKKKRDTRKKGQVARSNDLVMALELLLIFGLIGIMGPSMFQGLVNVFQISLLQYLQQSVTLPTLQEAALQLSVEIARVVLPVFLAMVVLAVFGNVVQFGFLLAGEPLKMQLKRLNPIEGVKRIFSVRALMEFAKSLIKFVAVTCVLCLVIWGEREQLLLLSQIPLLDAVAYVGGLVVRTGLAAGAVLLVLGLLDFAYQRWEHAKNLRMSKQEVKDELKRTEGDPLIRSRIRERQRSMALRRMMQEVPKADVIITNPTHYAVALRYDAEEMPAPQVIAKGQDYMALRIRRIAEEHGIIQVENPPLARTLYAQTEVGDWIPPELYQAVAEVLAYVMRLNGTVGQKGRWDDR